MKRSATIPWPHRYNYSDALVKAYVCATRPISGVRVAIAAADRWQGRKCLARKRRGVFDTAQLARTEVIA
jgi:hypothetical protein